MPPSALTIFIFSVALEAIMAAQQFDPIMASQQFDPTKVAEKDRRDGLSTLSAYRPQVSRMAHVDVGREALSAAQKRRYSLGTGKMMMRRVARSPQPYTSLSPQSSNLFRSGKLLEGYAEKEQAPVRDVEAPDGSMKQTGAALLVGSVENKHDQGRLQLGSGGMGIVGGGVGVGVLGVGIVGYILYRKKAAAAAATENDPNAQARAAGLCD